MPFRRALLSAITLFGGHFLNRRLDRVVLIGALLAVAIMASIAVPFALAVRGLRSFEFVTWALRLPLILVGTIALLSVGLTFRDARQAPSSPLSTTIRVTRMPLCVFGVLVVVAVFLVAQIPYTPVTEAEFAVPRADRLNFGNSGADTVDFLPPPEHGPERLRGRIMLDGAGIKGAQLSVTLNSQYRVAHLRSDSRGVFEIPLGAGKWHVNDIVVSDWDGRPKDRKLILFSDHEPMKDGGQYSRLNFQMADGLEVSLPAASSEIPVTIEFRDPLAMTWPAPGSVPDADFATAAITWQPVKGASEYEVQIGRFVREGTLMYSSAILTRRVSGLSLPLASLPQRSATSLADEYSVHIFAFDDGGRLLTESDAAPEIRSTSDINAESAGRMFKLTGATRLGRELQSIGVAGTPEVISAEYETNDLRLGLASILMDQKRFDDARRVLDQVTQGADHGRMLELQRRLAALQGNCATAIRLCDKAESGGGCASSEYRKLCPVP